MKRREEVELPEHVQRVLDRIVQEAQKLGRVEAVVLFGSWASGAARQDSDIDVIVVVDVREKLRVAGRLRVAVADSPIPVDIIIYRPEEWRWKQELEGMMPGDALREGVLWHGQAA